SSRRARRARSSSTRAGGPRCSRWRKARRASRSRSRPARPGGRTDERRSPQARSRGGNHVFPASPLLPKAALGWGNLPVPPGPLPRSPPGERPVSVARTELDQAIGAELDGLREAGTYKRANVLGSPQGPVVEMEGRGEVLVL